jgi:hypothetical protein
MRRARKQHDLFAREVDRSEEHRRFAEEHMRRLESQIERLDQRLSRVIELLESIDLDQRQGFEADETER